MQLRATTLALILLTSGCTAAKSRIHIIEAESALRRADDFNAKDRATYEYTLARRYLEKSIEEAGYSQYKSSERMAKKSAEWADKAIIFIERGGRAEIDLDDLRKLPDESGPSGEDATPEMVPPPDVPPPAGAPSDDALFAPAEETSPDDGTQEADPPVDPEAEEIKSEFEEIEDEEIDWDE